MISPEKTQQLILNELNRRKIGSLGEENQLNRVYSIHGKSVTLTARSEGTGLYLFGCISPDRVELRQNGQRFNLGNKFYTLTTQDEHGILTNGYIRKLHPIECERLQTLNDNYTAGITDRQRYIALGNGWTVDVIVHLLTYLKEHN